MPKYLVELTDGRKFEVEADQPPTENDLMSYMGKSQAPAAPKQDEGYLSQLGSALSLGGRQMASGVKATFNAATGDVPDTAAAMAQMGALQQEQQANMSSEDLALNQAFEQNKAEYDAAKGLFPTVGALGGYVGSIVSHPGAAFKQAVQSAPNAAISAGTGLAGYALGGLLGAGAGIETGPGAILTGIAGAGAGGAVSNTLMEAGPAIYDILNERTNGEASTMTADQISQFLRQNPDIMSEGLKTGAIRGSVIGVIEGLGMKGAGRIMSVPERAAARAAQKQLISAGVDVASKEAVDKALLDPALKSAVANAAKTAKDQFTTPGNLARLGGASALEVGSSGAGELAAQTAAGQETDMTAAVQEMMGEVALSAPTAAVSKGIEASKYFVPQVQEAISTAEASVQEAAAAGVPVSETAKAYQEMLAMMQRGEQDPTEAPSDVESRLAAIQSGPSAFYQQLQRGITPQAAFLGQETPSDVESRLAAIQNEQPIATATVGGLIPETPDAATVANLEAGSGDSAILGLGDDGGTISQEAQFEEARQAPQEGVVGASALIPDEEAALATEAPRITELARQDAAIASGAEKGADLGFEKVGNPKIKRLAEDLAFSGVGSIDGVRYAIQASPDGTFYVQKTTDGVREALALGQPDIETANQAALKIASNEYQEASTVGAKEESATQPAKPKPAKGGKQAKASTGGMSVEESKAYLARPGQILGFDEPSFLDSQRQKGKIKPAKPLTPTTEKPTSIATEGQTKPMSGDSGSVVRDKMKPEQMTPDGLIRANEIYNETTAQVGKRSTEELRSLEAEMRLNEKAFKEGMDDAQAAYNKVADVLEARDAIEKREPASAYFVDAYQITLPKGYVKDGELYVYRPEAKAEKPVSEMSRDEFNRGMAKKVKEATAKEGVMPEAEEKSQKKQAPSEKVEAGKPADKTKRDNTQPAQMTPEEYAGRVAGEKFVQSVAPGKEDAWWNAKESQGAPNRFAAGTKMASQENGKFFVLDLGTNKYKGFSSKREAMLFFKSKDGAAQRAYIETLNQGKAGTFRSISHRIAIDKALAENQPVSSVAVDAYKVKLPQGYEKRGDLYVSGVSEQPQVSQPAPTQESKQAPETAVNQKPEQPASQKLIDMAKQFGGRIAWADGDMGIIEAFQRFGSKSLYVAIVGNRYSTSDFTFLTPSNRKELLGENEELFLRKREGLIKDNEQKLADYPNGPFANGQTLVASKEVPEKVVSVFKEWAKMLGLNAPTRIVLTTFDGGVKMASSYGGKFRRIGAVSLLVKGDRGQFMPLGENDFHISYKDDISFARILEAIAHELGHVLQRQAFDKLPQDQRQAIMLEHEEWLKKVGSQKAIDGIKAMRSMRLGKVHPGTDIERFDELTAYWKSFSEWFADQVARWSTTTAKPLSIVEKFFARLGKKLREFFFSNKHRFAPNEKVSDWLNSLSPDFQTGEIDFPSEGVVAANDGDSKQPETGYGAKLNSARKLINEAGPKSAKAQNEALTVLMTMPVNDLQDAFNVLTGDTTKLANRRQLANNIINEILAENQSGKTLSAEEIFAQSERELEKEQERQEKLTESRQAAIAETVRSIAGNEGDLTWNAVSVNDGLEALAMLHNSGETPGLLNSFVGTSKEFGEQFKNSDNKEHQALAQMALNGVNLAEGYFLDSDGKSVLFTDKTAIKPIDRRIAEFRGIPPAVAASIRVLTHEGLGHRGWWGLSEKDRSTLVSMVKAIKSPADFDRLATQYPLFEDWATNPDSESRLAQEFISQIVESLRVLPKKGPVRRLLEYLQEVWQKYFGKKEGTLSMKELRLFVEMLQAGSKAPKSDLVNGGKVDIKESRPVYANPLDAQLASAAERMRQMREKQVPQEVDAQSIRNEIRKAYDAAIIGQGSVQAPLQQVYDIAKAAIPTLTEKQFGEQVQALYEDSSAFLVPTDRSADMLAAGEKWGVYDVAGLPASYLGVMPSQETTKVYATPIDRNAIETEIEKSSKAPITKDLLEGFILRTVGMYGQPSRVRMARLNMDAPLQVNPQPNGELVIGLGTRQAGEIIRNSRSPQAGFKYLADAIEEEMIHFADLLAMRTKWEAQGSNGSFTDFIRRQAMDLSMDLMQVADTLSASDKETFRKALAASLSSYRNDALWNDATLEDILQAYAETPMAANAELVRSLIQAKRSGEITATGYQRIANTLVKWLKDALNWLQQAYGQARNGGFGNVLAQRIQDTEKQLEMLGVMPTEIKASKAQKDVDTALHSARGITGKVDKIVNGLPANSYTGKPLQDAMSQSFAPLGSQQFYDETKALIVAAIDDMVKRGIDAGDILATVIQPDFTEEAMKGWNDSAKSVAKSIYFNHGLLLAVQKQEQLMNDGDITAANKQQDKIDAWSKFWFNLTNNFGVTGNAIQRAMEDPAYQGLYLLTNFAAQTQKAQKEVTDSNVANPNEVAKDINEVGAKSKTDADTDVADALTGIQVEDEIAAGEAALTPENRTLWERAKAILRSLARIAKAETFFATKGIKASNAAKSADEEVARYIQMGPKGVGALKIKLQKEFGGIVAKLTGTEKTGTARKPRTPKEEAVHPLIARLIARTAAKLNAGTNLDAALADLMPEMPSYRDRIVDDVVSGIVGRANRSIKKPKAPGVLADLTKQLKKILSENIKVEPKTLSEESLGKKALRAFGYVESNEKIIEDAWKKARNKVQETLQEENKDATPEEIQTLLNSLMSEAPKQLYSSSQARTIIRESLEGGKFDNSKEILDDVNGAREAVLKSIEDAVKQEKLANPDQFQHDPSYEKSYILNAFDALVADLQKARDEGIAASNKVVRDAVFGADGQKALKIIIRKLTAARPGIDTPLAPALAWKRLFEMTQTDQGLLKGRMFDIVKDEPAFADLDNADKQKLADILEKSWDARRQQILTNELERLRIKHRNRLTKKAAKVFDNRPAILKKIDSGVFDYDDLAVLVGAEFGIKPLTAAENKRAKEISARLSDDIPPYERTKLQNELQEMMVSKNLSLGEMLKAWWISAVLTGPRTAFTIGWSFLSGGYELMGHAATVLLNPKMSMAEKGAAIGDSIKNWWSSIAPEMRSAYMYVLTGDKTLQDPAALMQSAFFDNQFRKEMGRFSFSVAEKMITSKNPLIRYAGWFMTYGSRILNALDAFNFNITKAGSAPLVYSMLNNSYKAGSFQTSKLFKEARKKIVANEYGGIEPADTSRLNSWARNAAYQELSKITALAENMNQVSRQSNFTLEPTGFGGWLYSGLKFADSFVQKKSEAFVTRMKQDLLQGGGSKFDKAIVGIAELIQAGAMQTLPILGLQFAKFALNKLNQTISFIPVAGFMRLKESGVEGQRVHEAMIYRNQAVGAFLFSWVYLTLKAIEDEPDDEKRGWGIEGGWSNLTPQEKRQRDAAGLKEHTIWWRGKDGKRTVANFMNWPISPILAAAGAMSDQIKYSPEQWAQGGVLKRGVTMGWAMGKSVSETSALSQFTELFGSSIASRDPVEAFANKAARVFGGYAGGYIPRIFKDIDRNMQPEIRKYEGWEYLGKELPYYRRYIGKEYLDIFGNVIAPSQTPWSREFVHQPDKPEYTLLSRLNSHGVWLTPAVSENRLVGKGTHKREMTDEEANRYVKLVGKSYSDLVTRYTDRIIAMPKERARQFVLDKADEIRDKAAKQAIRKPIAQ